VADGQLFRVSENKVECNVLQNHFLVDLFTAVSNQNNRQVIRVKKGLYRRILAGVGSNAFGHIITIFIQLCSLPVFLHFWTLGQYGKWLMISAVPSYLSMADVGIVTSARNLMTMAMAAGDTNKANRVFQSALLFVICAVIFVSLTGYLLIFVFPIKQSLLVSEEIKIAL